MGTTEDELFSIIQEKDSTKIELYATTKNVGNILPRMISAFANTDGGTIVYGYADAKQGVVGTSDDDTALVKECISRNDLESFCNTYVTQYQEKTLIIIRVRKSESLVIAGGGAYKRLENINLLTMTSDEVLTRVATSFNGSGLSNECSIYFRRMYEEMRRTQTMLEAQNVLHIKEKLEYEERHNKEKKEQARKEIRDKRESVIQDVIFCVLGAVLGYIVGILF